MHLLVRLRIHEVKFVALVVEVLEFNFIEDGAVDEFLGAEPVIDDRAGLEILHARLHRAALVAGRAVIDAENGEKLARVLDDHAGAKLCGFNAAHDFVRPRPNRGPRLPERISDFGNSGGRPAGFLWLLAE